MSRLANWISLACDELGLKTSLGHVITLAEGHELFVLIHVFGLGATNGMLIVSSYEDVHAYENVLIQAGYGYAVLDEPHNGEEFDLASFKDMFNDWGWSGSAALKPAWMS